jgi:hypothetical protein
MHYSTAKFALDLHPCPQSQTSVSTEIDGGYGKGAGVNMAQMVPTYGRDAARHTIRERLGLRSEILRSR